MLERVQRTRAYADLALHGALARSHLSAPDRALATELVYGTLRWRGRLDFLLGQVLDRDLDKLEPLVASALRVGAYQILMSDRIPASAAVDQSVRSVRAAGVDRASGLVNAVLRRLASEHARIEFPPLATDPLGHLTHALSVPRWIAERLIERFGVDEAAALAAASNEPPPRTIRANPLRIERDALVRALGETHASTGPTRFAPYGLTLERRGDPGSDRHFLEGHYTIQDEASQLVVEMVGAGPGQRVLDTCAAPGAKATALAERVGPHGRVVALDRHSRRLGLVRRDARRLGLDWIETEERDASRSLDDLTQAGAFDAVLVDAPCSGLGTLRRNPDARWRVEPRDPERLSVLQQSILGQAAGTVRPGGSLVYSTCTLLAEENEGVVEWFLDEHAGFALVDRDRLPSCVQPLVGSDHFLRCLPHRDGMDGFFAARFERIS